MKKHKKKLRKLKKKINRVMKKIIREPDCQFLFARFEELTREISTVSSMAWNDRRDAELLKEEKERKRKLLKPKVKSTIPTAVIKRAVKQVQQSKCSCCEEE